MTGAGKMVVILASLGGLATGAALLAQHPREGAGGPAPASDAKEGLTGKALIEARLATARAVYEEMAALWRNGRADLHDAPLWSRRWMDEEIRLAADPAARRAAIAAHLERVRVLERLAESRHESARGAHADVLRVRYDRLVAEEMLADARADLDGHSTPRPATK